MKKIAKLSLVTAVALAGLTTASAASLESAVKNTDISGQFRFRSEDKSTVQGQYTDVEVEVGVKSKITDNITAVFKIDSAPNNGPATIRVEDYYFSYANNGMTVNYGEMNIPTRQLDGSQGTGLVVLAPVAGWTVGAAYFFTNGIPATGANDDVASVLVNGKAGPVSVLAQYVSTEIGTNGTGITGLNLKADAKFGPVMAGLELATVDIDGKTVDYGTTKVYVGAKAGMLNAKLTIATTEDGGSGSLDQPGLGATGNVEAASEFLMWQFVSAGKKELSVTALDVTATVTPAVSVRVAAATGDYEVATVKTDATETLFQVNYKVAKNLATYFRISEIETKPTGGTTTEVARGRVEIKYSF